MGPWGSDAAFGMARGVPMLRRLVVGELTIGGHRGGEFAREREKETRGSGGMTGGTRESERESGSRRASRPGRANGPRGWAKQASGSASRRAALTGRARAGGPDREEGKEKK
jgi:hypothetical protein